MDDLFEVNIWSPKETAPPEVKAFAKVSADLVPAVYDKLKKGTALKLVAFFSSVYRFFLKYSGGPKSRARG
jgi:hypothetical protein